MLFLNPFQVLELCTELQWQYWRMWAGTIGHAIDHSGWMLEHGKERYYRQMEGQSRRARYDHRATEHGALSASAQIIDFPLKAGAR
jgi:hypothetical protein